MRKGEVIRTFLRVPFIISSVSLIYLSSAFFRSGRRLWFGWKGGGAATLRDADAALRFALLKNSTELTDRGADGLCGSHCICCTTNRARHTHICRGLIEPVQSLGRAIEASHNVQPAVLETRCSLLLQQDPIGGGLFLLEQTGLELESNTYVGVKVTS